MQAAIELFAEANTVAHKRDVAAADVFPPTVTLRTLTDQIIAPVATNATSIPIFITFSEEIRIVGSGTTLLHTVNCTASAVVYTR